MTHPAHHDATLWTAFHRAAIPAADWTHRAHVRTAFLHLARWGLDESHLRMRVGIIRLNAAHGLEETPERGYHETLTRVWLRFVLHARGDAPPADSEVFLASYPELLERLKPLAFYSRERVFSLEARTIFVEPDLAPLP